MDDDDTEKQPEGKSLVVVDRKFSGPSCTWRLDPEQREVLKELFKPVFKFCYWSGAYLPRREGQPVAYYGRLLFLLSIATIASYELIYLCFYIVQSADYNVTTSCTLVYANWHFQSLLSVLFLIYWQRRRYFEDIFVKIHVPNGSAGCKRTKRCVRKVFAVYIATALVIFVVCVLHVVMIIFDQHHYIMFDLEAFNAYGSHMMIPFSFLISYYTFIFWIVAMMIYMSMTIAVYGELKYFNSQLRKLGENQDGECPADIGTELLSMYRTHSGLSDLVRALDNTFEVYTFAMIGTNIPTTIFSLLSLFVSLKTSWWNVFFAIPSVIACVMTMIALTAVPAKLHSAISEVEKIIYGNKAIWIPYSEKNYQIANLFISHVNQTNLGISIWGFAVVTKPLILTTISLTITYLSFFLQMRSSCDGSNCDNSTITN